MLYCVLHFASNGKVSGSGSSAGGFTPCHGTLRTCHAVAYAHLKDTEKLFRVPKPFAGNGAIALRREKDLPHRYTRHLTRVYYRKGGCIHMENVMIGLRGIAVDFDGERVLKGINLDIMDKEFITFLGPSGCGKTTTLRIIGGFVEPSEGDVFFEGTRINDLPPHKRQVNTIFQRYALFPHLNVYENIEFGLKVSKLPERERKLRVGDALELVGLKGYEYRNVNLLSGGQQQRIAIARAPWT